MFESLLPSESKNNDALNVTPFSLTKFSHTVNSSKDIFMPVYSENSIFQFPTVTSKTIKVCFKSFAAYIIRLHNFCSRGMSQSVVGRFGVG